jgi:hypothetical protein
VIPAAVDVADRTTDHPGVRAPDVVHRRLLLHGRVPTSVDASPALAAALTRSGIAPWVPGTPLGGR